VKQYLKLVNIKEANIACTRARRYGEITQIESTITRIEFKFAARAPCTAPLDILMRKPTTCELLVLEELQALLRFSSPTIANAIETFQVRPWPSGVTDRRTPATSMNPWRSPARSAQSNLNE
jgi:hypothetical protein